MKPPISDMTTQHVSPETLAVIAAAVGIATRHRGRIQQIRQHSSQHPSLPSTVPAGQQRQHITISGKASESITPEVMVAISAAVTALFPDEAGRRVRIRRIRYHSGYSETAWSQLGRLRMMLLKEVRRR
jgi:L-asparaginase/Glu-tRNA(Gln) amidotransferase subunit D